jgi:hypothetical protein
MVAETRGEEEQVELEGRESNEPEMNEKKDS